MIRVLNDRKKADGLRYQNLDLKQYTGSYSLPGDYAQIRVTQKAGRLLFVFVQDPNSQEELVRVRGHGFASAKDRSRQPWVFFKCDDQGEIIGLYCARYYFYKVKSN